MITLVGVGHVFQSRAVIEYLIGQRAPQVVGVELDSLRYEAMLSEEKDEDASLLIKLLVWAQSSIAKSYGADVGEEMLSAIDTALQHDLIPVFIDMPADKTAKPLFDSLGLKDKLMIGGSAVGAIVMPRRGVEKVLKMYEENPEKVEREMEKRMPKLKKILVDDRNAWMAKSIMTLHKSFPDVMAIVGDAHVPGIRKILKKNKLRPEVIRLPEVRDLIERIPKQKERKVNTDNRDKYGGVRVTWGFDGKYTLLYEGMWDMLYDGRWKVRLHQNPGR